MLNDLNQLNNNYKQHGYFVIRNYFSESEIVSLREVVLNFHDSWKQDNKEFYEEVAFNSSLITGSEYLNSADRIKLFNFISSTKIMQLVDCVIPTAAFMNTQLFFNPINPELKDFWHRDCQYDHDINIQKQVIKQTQVLHLRVPLFDEPGMELVPGTHTRWDNEEEFNVRQEIKGKLSNNNLSTGKTIKLGAGDILLFSADMIHRGIYGMDRLALDILVFDTAGDFADYVDDDCLPEPAILDKIKHPRLFLNSINLKKNN
ncbi:MAG: phytanoyl-CoA dioxygenase family protein [Saccharospirillaceae bacterium]|nr:phytanoyl-CoA dioxygenase family protein [Pseudomonadales bacterium]NRB78747.1 phytanoyl-CoA dioxygenase family protein [Saccharospirillaceae bacterium]